MTMKKYFNMTREDINNKINKAEIIVNKLNARLDRYLSLPNQADSETIRKIIRCSYKVGAVNGYIKNLKARLY